MACEELIENLENALGVYEAAAEYEFSVEQELTQAGWATLAAIGQVAMAAALVENCLNEQQNMRSVGEHLTELFSCPKKLKAYVSDVRERYGKKKPGK